MMLIEKMCIAVWNCRRERPDSDWRLPDWADIHDNLRNIVRAEMRAALEAAREPGPEIENAMHAVGIDQDPRDYWQAAISAALGEMG